MYMSILVAEKTYYRLWLFHRVEPTDVLLESVRLAVHPSVRVDSNASIRLVISPMASCNLINWSSDGNGFGDGCTRFTSLGFCGRPPSNINAYSTSIASSIASAKSPGFFHSSSCWLIAAHSPVGKAISFERKWCTVVNLSTWYAAQSILLCLAPSRVWLARATVGI